MKVCVLFLLVVDMIFKINWKIYGFGKWFVWRDICLGDVLLVLICWVMVDKVISDICIYVEKVKVKCLLLINILNNEDNLL